MTDAALRRDFGIASPVLAFAGLNPHAGEAGGLGREEIEIIEPAIAELRRTGIDARGPLPADTMFHAEARRSYDAALCMYHDQALIPIKTLDFYGGVNVTLGLPFVRTSPDHGTAFDIAGRGVARADSLIAALRLAAEWPRGGSARPDEQTPDLPAVAPGHRSARHCRAQRAWSKLHPRLQPDPPDRPGGRPARPCDRHRDRPRPRRVDARVAGSRRRRVVAIERDPRCLAALGELAPAYPSRLEVVAGDALTFDPVELRIRRERSSPTCPTTSPQRCCSVGSRASATMRASP